MDRMDEMDEAKRLRIVQKRFLLRLSPELYTQLERWAADELRSVNGQMEFVLRQAVEARRRSLPAREKPGHSKRDSNLPTE